MKRFKEWQLYAHYLLLAYGTLTYLGLQSSGNILDFFLGLATSFPVVLTLNYWMLALALLLIDTAVHAMFWYAPVKVAKLNVRWRD